MNGNLYVIDRAFVVVVPLLELCTLPLKNKDGSVKTKFIY